MAEQSQPSDPLYRLVVIGASAGGVEALTLLVAALPPGFSVPIVIAQHLDPTRPSQLGEILVRRSALPVQVITDGAAQPLAPGTIYVAPANRNVEITDTRIALRATAERGPKPSIDQLLATAASAYGEELIAVILTGSGSDGAAGARAVKRAGGTVVIQNPLTATYPSMPASLAPTTVDFVADLERIGPLLGDLVSGAPAPSSTAGEDLTPVLLKQVLAHNGLDFTRYKRASILRRLQRRMVATGTASLSDYLTYLDRSPDEYTRLITSFLVKVTSFFRDDELFRYLKERVIPDILAYARAHGAQEVRAWSAGCATGEEAYSLAILLREALGEEASDLAIRIYATDVDTAAIAFARRGVYSPAALLGMPPEYRQRYFRPVDGGFVIAEELRRLVIFGEHDLGRDAPFPRLDLVLCRNVLIYFTRELQQRASKLFAFSLREGGYLALGKAESAKVLADFFARLAPRLSVFRRQGGHVLAPPVRPKGGVAFTPGSLLLVPEHGAGGVGGTPDQPGQPTQPILPSQPLIPPRPSTSRERLGTLLLSLPLGVVVVDRHYDIAAINAIACQLLGIYRPVIGEDLLHLVERAPVQPVREALDAVTRLAASVAAPREIALEALNGEPRRMYMTLYPIPGEPEGSHGVESILIFVAPEESIGRAMLSSAASVVPEKYAWPVFLPAAAPGATIEAIEPRSDGQTGQTEAAPADVALGRQQSDYDALLARANMLEAANQELMAVNLELRRSEEEGRLRQEEMQADDEQIRTLNEELQATNEEIETVNEELEATVEELSVTNDDLLTRSRELQRLIEQRESLHAESERERARLAGVLTSFDEAVLVVDSAGKFMLQNPAYTAIFGTAASAADELPALYSPVGRRLHYPASPQARARENKPFQMEFQVRAPGDRLRWYKAAGRPIYDAAGIHLGGVVTFTETPAPEIPQPDQ